MTFPINLLMAEILGAGYAMNAAGSRKPPHFHLKSSSPRNLGNSFGCLLKTLLRASLGKYRVNVFPFFDHLF